MHTTNYVNTFIAVAEDCPADHGVVPPVNPDKPTIAARMFEMISQNPYRYTSDDVIFTVHADRSAIGTAERASARKDYFATGRPCLRASDLGKKYGWGIHCDEAGRIALYAVNSTGYLALSTGAGLTDGTVPPASGPTRVLRAMRSSRR